MHFTHLMIFTTLVYNCALLKSNKFVKPSFGPYCQTNSTCRLICRCELSPNCSLLSMNNTIRESILFYHNEIRNIQSKKKPEPSGLAMLQYDTQLEEVSKCWASQCSNQYSNCYKTPKFDETSQSVIQLILEEGTKPNVILWKKMMTFWLKKAESFSLDIFKVLPYGKEYEILHNFAQLLSSEILFTGCAWSITENLLTFVCTYGPRGPIPGEKIYMIGYSCFFCPQKYTCDYQKPFELLCKQNIFPDSTLRPFHTKIEESDTKQTYHHFTYSTTSRTVTFLTATTSRKHIQTSLSPRDRSTGRSSILKILSKDTSHSTSITEDPTFNAHDSRQEKLDLDVSTDQPVFEEETVNSRDFKNVPLNPKSSIMYPSSYYHQPFMPEDRRYNIPSGDQDLPVATIISMPKLERRIPTIQNVILEQTTIKITEETVTEKSGIPENLVNTRGEDKPNSNKNDSPAKKSDRNVRVTITLMFLLIGSVLLLMGAIIVMIVMYVFKKKGR